jgi:hypothetical protein
MVPSAVSRCRSNANANLAFDARRQQSRSWAPQGATVLESTTSQFRAIVRQRMDAAPGAASDTANVSDACSDVSDACSDVSNARSNVSDACSDIGNADRCGHGPTEQRTHGHEVQPDVDV